MKITSDQLRQEFLSEHFPRVKDWTVGDIRKASRISKDGTTGENGSLVGAYILWCAAIEYFGGLLMGPESTTEQRIQQFVEKYLSKTGNYNAKHIYDLRWSLSHYFTPRGYSVLAQELDEITLHLKITNKGCSIHLGSAISNLETAVDMFEVDLKEQPKMREVAFEYYAQHRVIKPIEFTEIQVLGECDH